MIADELRQRTFQFSLQILKFCRSLPNSWESREIGRQLLRAGMGTVGNYCACRRGRSPKEFVARLGVAVEESDEAVLWLLMIAKDGLGDQTQVQPLLAEGREILAILSKSHRTARENERKRRETQKQ